MKFTRTNLILSITAAVIALLVFSFFGFWCGQATASANDAAIEQESLLLKDYHGQVALFIPTSDTPETVYDIYSQTLPKLDQQRLLEGIPLKDEQELKLYLNDFDS